MFIIVVEVLEIEVITVWLEEDILHEREMTELARKKSFKKKVVESLNLHKKQYIYTFP